MVSFDSVSNRAGKHKGAEILLIVRHDGLRSVSNLLEMMGWGYFVVKFEVGALVQDESG